MTFIMSESSIFAVNTTREASGISTIMLNSASVIPIEIPKPGMRRLFVFIIIILVCKLSPP